MWPTLVPIVITVFTTENSPHISGPTQSKPLSFKDHLSIFLNFYLGTWKNESGRTCPVFIQYLWPIAFWLKWRQRFICHHSKTPWKASQVSYELYYWKGEGKGKHYSPLKTSEISQSPLFLSSQKGFSSFRVRLSKHWLSDLSILSKDLLFPEWYGFSTSEEIRPSFS